MSRKVSQMKYFPEEVLKEYVGPAKQEEGIGEFDAVRVQTEEGIPIMMSYDRGAEVYKLQVGKNVMTLPMGEALKLQKFLRSF